MTTKRAKLSHDSQSAQIVMGDRNMVTNVLRFVNVFHKKALRFVCKSWNSIIRPTLTTQPVRLDDYFQMRGTKIRSVSMNFSHLLSSLPFESIGVIHIYLKNFINLAAELRATGRSIPNVGSWAIYHEDFELENPPDRYTDLYTEFREALSTLSVKGIFYNSTWEEILPYLGAVSETLRFDSVTCEGGLEELIRSMNLITKSLTLFGDCSTPRMPGGRTLKNLEEIRWVEPSNVWPYPDRDYSSHRLDLSRTEVKGMEMISLNNGGEVHQTLTIVGGPELEYVRIEGWNASILDLRLCTKRVRISHSADCLVEHISDSKFGHEIFRSSVFSFWNE